LFIHGWAPVDPSCLVPPVAHPLLTDEARAVPSIRTYLMRRSLC